MYNFKLSDDIEIALNKQKYLFDIHDLDVQISKYKRKYKKILLNTLQKKKVKNDTTIAFIVDKCNFLGSGYEISKHQTILKICDIKSNGNCGSMFNILSHFA